MDGRPENKIVGGKFGFSRPKEVLNVISQGSPSMILYDG
jgi:hypothetical protein